MDSVKDGRRSHWRIEQAHYVIDTDLIPQELQRIEYLIGLKRDQLKTNMARQWDLQQAEKGFRDDLTQLEIEKYRLLTGRSI